MARSTKFSADPGRALHPVFADTTEVGPRVHGSMRPRTFPDPDARQGQILWTDPVVASGHA